MRSIPVLGELRLPGQTIAVSIVTAILSVAAVQTWWLHLSRGALEQRMERNLDADLKLLKAHLERFGSGWSSDGSRLLLGETSLEGHNEVVVVLEPHRSEA